MKQTAVEWIVSKLSITFQTMYIEEIKQAKEMEKEQIKQAYLDSSQETCRSYGEEAPHDDPKFAELYYKQKYATK